MVEKICTKHKDEKVFFIDDKADYLVGAKAAGIITIHFQSPEQVMAELRKMGVRF